MKERDYYSEDCSFSMASMDPTFARNAGFDQPILHRQCTFGIVGRLISEGFCGALSAQLKELVAQLRGPVVPGECIAVDVWILKDGKVRFTAPLATAWC